jgi:hypothetical protein
LTSYLWKKIDPVENPPYRLGLNDKCYYARDYVAHGGYAASEANQLILNFKKPMSRQKTPEWRHKLRAVRQFARELSSVLPDGATIGSIPSSIEMGDPDYDPRLDWTLELLRKMSRGFAIEYPITRRMTTQSVHDGARRDPAEIYIDLEWKGFKAVPDSMFLIDDVITTGAHFKACQQLIREHHSEIEIVGLFWARTIWPSITSGDVRIV